jgi:hypothetical protein
MILCSCGGASEPSIVAWVNGIPIDEREMGMAMNQKRSLVLNYFYEKHGVADSSTFWRESHGGEVPIEVLKKQAMDALVQYKVERGLAYEEKLIQSLDYDSFLSEWQQENKRRKGIVAKGGVIYGPVEFSVEQYVQYKQSNLMIDLKEAWAKSQRIQEELLLSEYERTKEERYRRSDQFQIEVVTLPYNRNNRESLLRDMKNRMEEWKREKGSIQKLPMPNGALYEQYTYTRGEDSVEASHPVVWEAIQGLRSGESSEIMDERSAWVWFHVSDRQPGGYEEFDKVKEAVRNYYIEEQFQRMIGEKVRLAEVKINRESYEALSA